MQKDFFKLAVLASIFFFCERGLYAFAQGTPVNAPSNSAGANAYLPEEIEKGITVKDNLISLDVKGIDIVDFLRILSIKINKSIIPTKGVTGKATFF